MPGVSSIAAVPAAAGIPVTHRGVSDRVTIASCQGADGSEAEYARLAAIGGTLILFMGLGRVERVVAWSPRGRTAAGYARRRDLARDAPRPGGVRRRRSHTSQSATIGLASPTLLIIGDVAALELLAPARVVPRALDHVA